MFSNLSTFDLILFMGVLGVGAIMIGWLAEGILGSLAFGIGGNAVLAFAGSVGGLLLLENAQKNRWVPAHLPVEPLTAWVLAACFGSVLLIVFPLLLRRLFAR